MKTSIAALCLAFLTTTNVAVATEAMWYDDFDKAVAAAKEQKKDLFVDFTGSDWCHWCKILDKEVFAHDEFLGPIQENFILVALDFPNSEEAKAKVPNPERNEELMKKYEIQGFPTILMMSADGEVFAQTGYQAGGPEKYLASVNEMAASGKKALVEVPKALAAFEAAEGDAKTAAWEQVEATFSALSEGSMFAAQMVESVKWPLTFDADNSKGLRLRAVKALLGKGVADDEICAAGIEYDPKNETGLYEQAVRGRFHSVQDDTTAKAALAALDTLLPLGFQDKEIGFMLTFTAAMWSHQQLADPEGAKEYAAEALAIGTDDEDRTKMLTEIVEG